MSNSLFNTNKGEQAALIFLLLGIVVLKSLCFDFWHLQHPHVKKRLALDSTRYEIQSLALQYRFEGSDNIPGSTKNFSAKAGKYPKSNEKYPDTFANSQERNKSFPKKDDSLPERKLSLQSFDPNLADTAQLQALGLSSFVLRNILKYRERGGVFRKKSDLAKIYGLSQQEYNKLEPYILLPETEPDRFSQIRKEAAKVLTGQTLVEQTKNQPVAFEQADYQQPESEETDYRQTATGTTIPRIKREPLSVNTSAVRPQTYSKICRINTADTADLIQYPGIGQYTAKRILDYRDRLGGYYSPDQLDEISGIFPENLSVLKQCLKADSTKIHKLKLNQCGLEQFRSHPYLSFYQARALVELRQARGKIDSLEELLFLEEFSEQDLKRLLPYLDCR